MGRVKELLIQQGFQEQVMDNEFEKMWDFVHTVENSPLVNGEFSDEIYSEAEELQIIAKDCFSNHFKDPLKIVATISIQSFCAGWYRYYNLEP